MNSFLNYIFPALEFFNFLAIIYHIIMFLLFHMFKDGGPKPFSNVDFQGVRHL